MYTFLSYLTDVSHSNPPSFRDCFPKSTTNFGLVPPLVVALAVRRINRLNAGPTGGHLRDKPLTLLSGRARGIRKLQEALRITDDFSAIALSVFNRTVHVVPLLVFFPATVQEEPPVGTKKLMWRRDRDGATLPWTQSEIWAFTVRHKPKMWAYAHRGMYAYIW